MNHLLIKKYYEQCFAEFGDNHLGVNWPNEQDALKRYQVMLDLVINDNQPCSLLDFGCGTSALYEFIKYQNLTSINYSGLDISEQFILASKKKYPEVDFYCGDILDNSFEIPNFDYIILNGVFTVKRELSFNQMFEFLKHVLIALKPKANKAIAFNVMSSHVDWQRDDLFHLTHDMLADFLIKKFGRKYVIRSDYGLYEYTTYVYS